MVMLMRKQHRILKDYSRRKSQIFEEMRKKLEKPQGKQVRGFSTESTEESVKNLIERVDNMRTRALRGQQ